MTITTLVPPATHDDQLPQRFARDVMPYRDVLYRGARRLSRTEADAEDLLQDTLMRAYIGFGGFRDGTNLQAWLFKILYNRWVSAHRSKQCRPTEVAEAALTDHALARCADPSPEADVVEGLADPDVMAAMASLPDGFAEVMYLSLVEGYTYADTAELLGVPVGTVMSRVHRGRQRLRVALAHRAPDQTATQHVA